ncbi:hypothetical protein [uncultured Roseibium sp.]|uniref:hypothetical protein n=1 Tax=uncultured Roseibium sp. TaxID=1936171 RepID=UPI0032167DE7
MTADPITMLQVFFFLLVASAFADVLTMPMGIGGGSFGVSFMTRPSVAIQRAVANRHRFSPLDRRTCGDRLHFPPDCSPSALLVQADRYPNLTIIVSMTLLTAPNGAHLAHSLQPG